MKYILKNMPSYLKLCGKTGLMCGAVAAVIIICQASAGSISRESVIKTVCVLADVWLFLCVIMCVLLVNAVRRAIPYLDIFVEKGFCDEYVNEFKRIEIDERSNPTAYAKLQLASVYLAMGRYDPAEAIYENVNIYKNSSTKDEKCLYYNDLMALDLARFRTDDAAALYNEASIFMGEAVRKKHNFELAWSDNYMSLLFQQGKPDEAIRYFENVLIKLFRKGDYRYSSLTTAACGMLLCGRQSEAEDYLRQAREAAESFDGYEYSWQRDWALGYIYREFDRTKKYLSMTSSLGD